MLCFIDSPYSRTNVCIYYCFVESLFLLLIWMKYYINVGSLFHDCENRWELAFAFIAFSITLYCGDISSNCYRIVAMFQLVFHLSFRWHDPIDNFYFTVKLPSPLSCKQCWEIGNIWCASWTNTPTVYMKYTRVNWVFPNTGGNQCWETGNVWCTLWTDTPTVYIYFINGVTLLGIEIYTCEHVYISHHW